MSVSSSRLQYQRDPPATTQGDAVVPPATDQQWNVPPTEQGDDPHAADR